TDKESSMEQRNLIIAAIISIAIIFGFQFFYEVPRMEQQRQVLEQQQELHTGSEGTTTAEAPPAPEGTAPPVPAETAPPAFADRGALIAEDKARGGRVTINSPRLSGSISLRGARIDDLVLEDYHLTTEDDSP